MKGLMEIVGDWLVGLADEISTSTGCTFFWGEPEMPECLRENTEE